MQLYFRLHSIYITGTNQSASKVPRLTLLVKSYKNVSKIHFVGLIIEQSASLKSFFFFLLITTDHLIETNRTKRRLTLNHSPI